MKLGSILENMIKRLIFFVFYCSCFDKKINEKKEKKHKYYFVSDAQHHNTQYAATNRENTWFVCVWLGSKYTVRYYVYTVA